MEAIQSINRAILIMELLSVEGSMDLSQLYEVTKINKASILRILYTLEENQYIRKNKNGKYSLTVKLFELGTNNIRSHNQMDLIRSSLSKLTNEYDVISQYSIEDDNQLFCLESFDPSNSGFSLYTRVGQRSPLYATSAGKAILSSYSNEEVIEKWDSFNVHKYTENTITDINSLIQELNQIRKKNYATDNEETEYGLFCVGSIIRNYNKQAIGAISLSTNSLSKEREQELSAALLEHIILLSKNLGYF